MSSVQVFSLSPTGRNEDEETELQVFATPVLGPRHLPERQ